MSSYMITYDLNKSGQNYDDVIKTIKECSSYWCSYWRSSYLIKSSLTADQICKKLNPYLDSNDLLIVVESKNSNYQGWLTDEQWKFINEKILN